MAKNTDGLIPIQNRAKSVQRKIRSKGGKARAKKVRETKELIRISTYLHEFIDSQQEDVRDSLKRIVKQGGQPLLSLIKEVREATEGSKMALMNPDGSELLSKGIKVSFEDAEK